MKTLNYNELEILKEYSNDNRTEVTVIGLSKDKKSIIIATFSCYVDRDNKLKRSFDGNRQYHDSYANTPANLLEAEEVFDEVVASLKSLIAS